MLNAGIATGIDRFQLVGIAIPAAIPAAIPPFNIKLVILILELFYKEIHN